MESKKFQWTVYLLMGFYIKCFEMKQMYVKQDDVAFLIIQGPRFFWSCKCLFNDQAIVNKDISIKKVGRMCKITISSTKTDDSGIYSCSLPNYVSDSITLTVQGKPALTLVQYNPRIQTSYSSAWISVNRPVNIICQSTGSHETTLELKYDNLKLETSRKVSETANILIYLIEITVNFTFSLSSENTLTCEASIDTYKDSTQMNINTIDIRLTLPNETFLHNDDVLFTCKAVSFDDLNNIPLSFLVDGKELNGINHTNYQNKIKETNITVNVNGHFNNKKINCHLVERNVYSASGKLNIQYSPGYIRIHPYSQQYVNGTFVNKSFVCKTQGNPSPTYKWFYNGVIKSNSSTLTFGRELNINDAGLYRCEASNKYGKVLANSEIDILYAPVCNNHRKVYVRPFYSNILLNCSVKAHPPVRSYYWYKNNSIVGYSEMLSTVTTTDSIYYCIAENNQGFSNKCFHFVILLEISINYYQPVIAGTKHTLSCKLTANINTTVYWIINGKILDGLVQSISHENETFSVLNHLTHTFNKEDNNKTIICMEKDNSSSEAVVLNILYPPQNLKLTPEIIYIKNGSNTNLSIYCHGDANPPPVYIYKFNNSYYHGSRLIIEQLISLSDERYYECQATNEVGKTKVNGSIIILYISIIYHQPIVAGIKHTFSCKLLANKNTTVYWIKNEKILDGQVQSISHGNGTISVLNQLTHTFTKEDNNKKLICIEKNKFISEGVILNVLYPPQNLKIDPEVIYIKNGSTTNLKIYCHGDANPPPIYIYHFNNTHYYGSTIVINQQISLSDERYFECQAFNEVGETKVNGSIIIFYAPVCKDSLHVHIKPFYSNLTLNCLVDANPPVDSYYWYHNMKIVSNSQWINFIAATDTIYYCMAYNSQGFSGKCFHYVYRLEILISYHNPIIAAYEHTFNCTLLSNINTTTVWLKNGEKLYGKLDSILNWNGIFVVSNQLKHKFTKEDNNRTLTCMEENNHTAETITLNILYRPICEDTDNFYSFSENLNVTLKCNVKAYPFPSHYYWYEEASDIMVGNSYEHKITTNKDIIFYCIAKNNEGISQKCRHHINVLGSYNSWTFLYIFISAALILLLLTGNIISIYLIRNLKKKKCMKEDSSILEITNTNESIACQSNEEKHTNFHNTSYF